MTTDAMLESQAYIAQLKARIQALELELAHLRQQLRLQTLNHEQQLARREALISWYRLDAQP